MQRPILLLSILLVLNLIRCNVENAGPQPGEVYIVNHFSVTKSPAQNPKSIVNNSDVLLKARLNTKLEILETKESPSDWCKVNVLSDSTVITTGWVRKNEVLSGIKTSDWGIVKAPYTNVNVREKRESNSKIVSKLKQGQDVKAFYLKDNWYAIFNLGQKTIGESNAIGYVYAPLLNPRKKKKAQKINSVLPYEIVKVENDSFKDVARFAIKIIVESVLDSKQLMSISEKVIEKQKIERPHNAILLLYYLPESDIGRGFTAGRVVWAPYGNWSKSDHVTTGDYSQHEMKITVGNATGLAPKKFEAITISVNKKKKIFYELVKAQDDGYEGRAADRLIAAKYDLDSKTIDKIVAEGLAKGWPMP
ncbi:MAG: hypothetical protein HQ556_11600 [Candidatus Marinimicrobia bacterium]|nr:hypothetical protein [Candidatus Neomarinimicrobiota bacterium]